MISPGASKLIASRGLTTGWESELSRPEIVLGRESGVDLVIPSPAVSRRHARLVWLEEGYALEDLGSSNGTFLNGQRVTGRVPLQHGDRIGLGQAVILIFEAHLPEQETLIDPAVRSQTDARRLQAGAGPLDGPPSGPVPTLLGEEPVLPIAPPQFVVSIAGGESRTYPLKGGSTRIGRAPDNDLVVDSPIVSRYHARLEQSSSGNRLVPLQEAGNPVLFEGRPLSSPRILRHGDVLRIGSQDPGVMVTLTYHSPSEARVAARPILFGENTRLQIGRDTSCDVILPAPTISRFHAQIERVGQRYRVRDLGSANGVFVNDERVGGEVWVKAEDEIRVGPYRFVVGQDQLHQFDESSGLRVEATGLNKWVRKDLNLLKDISLVFQPREFIVIVGQSGGGKSTLVDAIAGYRPATHGRVLVNGTNVYRNFDAVRSEIGFVPQKDIIHMELTVYQALDYAAQLRMPADTSPAERDQRVMEVLQDLDLVHRKDVQISGLSGGQQKRVSIGVELITKPGLFFLDEPTSGLDPGTETALMQLMRRLADQGRTILLITHATKNVMLADKVVFLARGGWLAWFGPPEEALQYFDQYRSERDRRAGPIEFDGIYAILDDPQNGSAEEWAKRYRSHLAYQHYLVQPLQKPGGPAAARSPSYAQPGGAQGMRPVEAQDMQPSPHRTTRRDPASAVRQFFILSSRNLKILTRDRFSLILMLAAAPLISILDVILSFALGRNLFSFQNGNITNVITSLFMLTVYGVMVSGLSQMRELVKEADIYRRERLVNLKVAPYVLSKAWVALLLALYQAAVYIGVHYLFFDMPGGALELVLMYFTLTLVTIAGMMLGLFASALAPNANAAPLLVIMLMLPQFVLGGALVPLPGFVTAPTSTRWAFEALMGIGGAGSDVAADACWALPEALRAGMTLDDKQAAGCRCMGLNALNPDSCSFPGLGRFHDAALDQAPPIEPEQLGQPPAEPAIPEPPQEPQNQADNVAMAAYLQALKEYQASVQVIQDDYKAQVEQYQAKAEVFKSQSIAYQESLARYQIARSAAAGKAEAVIDQFNEKVGWTYVDKRDAPAFWSKILFAWSMQAAIILVLLGSTLLLVKRKDRMQR